jgi:predicted membrane channel-forming protein YqfA (hemolysin III family)
MFKKGPIPPFIHGLLDYGLAALLIASPFLFGFEDDAATAVAIVAGVLVLIIGASTDWVTGIIKVIPPPAHAMLDYLMVVVLIATPFLFAFTDSDGTATAFFIVVGVLGLLLAIATRFTPEPRGRRGRAPATPGA